MLVVSHVNLLHIHVSTYAKNDCWSDWWWLSEQRTDLSRDQNRHPPNSYFHWSKSQKSRKNDVLSSARFSVYITKTDVMAMTRLVLMSWLVIQLKSKVLNKFSLTKRILDLPKGIWEMKEFGGCLCWSRDNSIRPPA